MFVDLLGNSENGVHIKNLKLGYVGGDSSITSISLDVKNSLIIEVIKYY